MSQLAAPLRRNRKGERDKARSIPCRSVKTCLIWKSRNDMPSRNLIAEKGCKNRGFSLSFLLLAF
nr:MAG TPA: hypothetical protein [Caudoviricetes sp.]